MYLQSSIQDISNINVDESFKIYSLILYLNIWVQNVKRLNLNYLNLVKKREKERAIMINFARM